MAGPMYDSLVSLVLTPQGMKQSSLKQQFEDLLEGLGCSATVRSWRSGAREVRASVRFTEKRGLEKAWKFLDKYVWNDYGYFIFRTIERDVAEGAEVEKSIGCLEGGSTRVFSSDGWGASFGALRQGRTRTSMGESQSSLLEEEKSQGSRVLHVSEVDPRLLSVSALRRLFSEFGPVNRGMVMRNLRKAMIEFTDLETAKAAHDFFSQTEWGWFSVCFSFHQRIQTPVRIGRHNEFFESNLSDEYRSHELPIQSLDSLPSKLSQTVKELLQENTSKLSY